MLVLPQYTFEFYSSKLNITFTFTPLSSIAQSITAAKLHLGTTTTTVAGQNKVT